MIRQPLARTAIASAFSDLFPNGTHAVAMPGEKDIGGGDTAGWGRGCYAPVWLESAGGIAYTDAAHRRRLLWVPGSAPELLDNTPGVMVGAAVDAQGRWLGCDWEGRRIVAQAADGTVAVLADGFDGRTLNRPGDICAGPADSLFFTDQKFAFPPDEPGRSSLPRSGVYRICADGSIHNSGITVQFPGGLLWDRQRGRLLVTAPRERAIYAYPLTADGHVDPHGCAVFARLEGCGKGAPHGLCQDSDGHIYTGGLGGLWMLDSDGTVLGILHLTASRITGVAIGGGRLFVTTPVGVGYIEPARALLAAGSAPAAPAVLRQPLGFDQAIERHDPAFDRIIPADARIANLASGGFFDDLGGGEDEYYSRSLEGLYWDSREACLMFSDIGNSRRMRFTPATGAITQAHYPTGNTNGATLDSAGNVLSCEHSERRVSVRLANGDRVTLVDRTADGRRLNHPNDIVMRSDGNIYFTDPWWDFGAGETSEIGHAATWRLSPQGVLEEFAGNWRVCNGLALSVDEHVLFVNDSYGPHIRAFDLDADGRVDSASDRIFCELNGTREGKPDGMKIDTAGNVYCGGSGGLWVFSPEGRHLGTIVHGSTQTNNICFGGTDWQTLYFCSWTSLHSVALLVPGIRTLDAR